MDNQPPAAPPPAPPTQPGEPAAPIPPGAPAPPPTPTPNQPSPTPSRPSKRKAIIIAAVIVVIALVVAGVLVFARPSHKHEAGGTAHRTESQTTSNDDSNASSDSLPPDNGLSPQPSARDSKRRADILSVQTQLEAYFQNFGYYPSLTDLNDPGWRAANMKTLDYGALADPLSSCDPQKAGCLVAAPAAKAYAYAVTDSDGNSCEADATRCARYTLTATLERPYNDSRVFSKSNLD